MGDSHGRGKRSKVLESENPWYQGVALYTMSRGTVHNNELH